MKQQVFPQRPSKLLTSEDVKFGVAWPIFGAFIGFWLGSIIASSLSLPYSLVLIPAFLGAFLAACQVYSSTRSKNVYNSYLIAIAESYS
jgi:hypothetical protein